MTAETDKAALRSNLVRACFDPGSFIGPRGSRTTDEWRAGACLHLLAPVLAQAESDRAALDNAQKLNRDLHRRTQKAERFRARWGGSAINYIIAKIKERRARRVAEGRADRLAAKVEALRAALKPFSQAAIGWDKDENVWHEFGDHESIDLGESNLTVGHLRAARMALARAADKPGERADSPVAAQEGQPDGLR